MNDETETAEPSTGGALDPVALAILDALHAAKPGSTIAPEVVARAIGTAKARPSDRPNAWRRYLAAVKQQALHLARQGRIEIVRKGKPVDLADFKGVVRYRLPTTTE